MAHVLKWVRRAVLVLAAIYLGLMLLGVLVDTFVAPTSSTIELIKTLFELGLWLAIPALILLVLLRAWRLAVVGVIVVIIFGAIYGPYLIPRPAADTNAPQLTVLTFNVQATASGIADAIRAADADVVAVQELSQASADALEELDTLYPHQALHPQADPNAGQGILSRYPILADDYWEYPNVPHTLGHQRVEIDVDGTRVVIYSTHPWPPLGWESGYNDESHHVVLQDIAARTFAEELPLILVGDFNMTDNFGEYDLLASRFTDSYRAAGDGLGYTFPNFKFEPLPPVLRLDYIWHSTHFESVDSQVWGLHGASDHSPLLTTLALAQGDDSSGGGG